MKIISLDTEATGIDWKRGAMPFMVQSCANYDRVIGGSHCPAWKSVYWQWDVDPLTRVVDVQSSDLDDIVQVIDEADVIWIHNAKFDAHALAAIGIKLPWRKVMCSLMGSHLLASNHKHNLTDTTIEHLGHDIEQFEKNVKVATQRAMIIVRRDLPDWKIAKEDDPDAPSINNSSKRDEDKAWKSNMWLPRALLFAWDEIGVRWDEDNELATWPTVTSDYGCADTDVTLPLGIFMEKRIKKMGCWEIFLERMNLPRIAFDMERRGVTASADNTDAIINEYGLGVAEAQDVCLSIAAEYGHDLQLPAGAAPNDSIREFFFGSCVLTCPRCGKETRVKEWNGGGRIRDDEAWCPICDNPKRKSRMKHLCHVQRNPCLNLPKIYKAGAKSDAPTLNTDAMEHYKTTLDGKSLEFIEALTGMRSRQTAVGYAESYKRFWIPDDPRFPRFNRLSPSFNPCGTDHLRWASYNPNSQNISKKEGFNLRYCFCPRPDREWWSMDFANIELRIPAYESGEEAMIELFERPNDPPYFGSYHLLNASIVYPNEFWPLAEKEGEFKKRYKATLYQWVKNGGFAIQYGCGMRKADATFRVNGAFKMLKEKLPKVAKLNDHYVQMANRLGYVETIPDREVCPERGYPILASRTEDGRVSATTPFNYHVSGTAMQTTNKAMIRVTEQIDEWNAEGWDGYLTLQIHDELLFDFPRGDPTNVEKAMTLRALMESCGDCIGIPTPVSVEYHDTTWATGVAM